MDSVPEMSVQDGMLTDTRPGGACVATRTTRAACAGVSQHVIACCEISGKFRNQGLEICQTKMLREPHAAAGFISRKTAYTDLCENRVHRHPPRMLQAPSFIFPSHLKK